MFVLILLIAKNYFDELNFKLRKSLKNKNNKINKTRTSRTNNKYKKNKKTQVFRRTSSLSFAFKKIDIFLVRFSLQNAMFILILLLNKIILT